MNNNQEFREVHAARQALATYIENNRNIDLIRNIPLTAIGRYDVWQCVFENESLAYKELQIKELYFTFFECLRDNCTMRMLAVMGVTLLGRLVEFSTPLGIDEGIKVILDVMGNDFLKELIVEAEKQLKRRQEIMKTHLNDDVEWTGYSLKVLNELNKYAN